MANAGADVSGALIFAPIIIAGVIFLQILLSRLESKWLGLVLPGILLILCVLGTISLYSADGRISSVEHIYDESGEIIDTVVHQEKGDGALFMAFSSFIIGCIPAVILLVIYFVCREKFKKDREIYKMSIQDLE